MTGDEKAFIRVVRQELEPLTAEVHRVANQVSAINGSVARHDEEIFGDERTKTVGLREEMNAMHDLVVSLKASARTLQYLIGILGVGNIAAVVIMAVR